MGDKKAQRLPEAGSNSGGAKGKGPNSMKPGDDARGAGLGAMDAQTGQNRSGRNSEGTGL